MTTPSEEAVLFVHSTGTAPLMWAGVPPAAIGDRRGVFPANLGYPPNDLLPRGARVTVDDEIAHLLAQVPDDVTRLHVVAHSYGATVALAALPRLRGRLASLFLAEPVLFGALAKDPDTAPALVADYHRFADDLADETNAGTEAWLEGFIDYWNRPGSWKRLPEPMRDYAKSVGWKMFQEVRICFGADTPFDDYAIDVPTTLVMGDRTTPHSRAVQQRLARGRANVKLVEIAGTGHMAPVTHPALVHAEIAKHFR